jgi:hypothetical protein
MGRAFAEDARPFLVAITIATNSRREMDASRQGWQRIQTGNGPRPRLQVAKNRDATCSVGGVDYRHRKLRQEKATDGTPMKHG